MKKRKKKRICNNVDMKGVICASIFFLIGVLITVQAIQKIVLVSQGDEGVIEYQGEYEDDYEMDTNDSFLKSFFSAWPEDYFAN